MESTYDAPLTNGRMNQELAQIHSGNQKPRRLLALEVLSKQRAELQNHAQLPMRLKHHHNDSI